jgi:hypothetical protein
LAHLGGLYLVLELPGSDSEVVSATLQEEDEYDEI